MKVLLGQYLPLDVELRHLGPGVLAAAGQLVPGLVT